MIPCLTERATPATTSDGASARQGGAKARGAAPPTPIDDLIARWAARGWLRPLDAAFAGLLRREVPDANPWLILAAALASHQLGRGHVCLDLAAALEDPGFALSLPPEGASEDNLAANDLPGRVLDGTDLPAWIVALGDPRLVGHGPGNAPLVLRGSRLYLRRYWEYERSVREGIDQRLARTPEVSATLSPKSLRSTLDILFPAAGMAAATSGADWQKLACALAARSAFGIVTGGPGTGKTTTVVKLLALLQTLALSAPAKDGVPARPLRIRLAAPTGKAAARLNESIAGAVRSLPLKGLPNEDTVRASIPTEVGTLHRLLGARPDTRRMRHDARNPLALDVLVIDEASMIDLEMMAAVLAALPPRSRLVLLGDKDQLASVEAGAVLGELCARAREGHFTPDTAKWLQAATGEQVDAALQDAGGTALDQAVAMLRKSYRFSEASGIGQLASKVNEGTVAPALQVLAQPHRDLQTLRLRGEADPSLRDLVVDGRAPGAGRPGDERHGYRHYLETMHRLQPAHGSEPSRFDEWACAVLEAHTQFQVLCALRRGPWGVEGLNRRIAGFLQSAGLIGSGAGWYLGRPVLVTRNDYALGLMNGDMGITLALPGKENDTAEPPLRVAFPAGDGKDGIKWVLPSRLQAVETVYALTVHKSQGSEFSHAALILPDKLNPVLTRELLYTGITRARTLLTLVNPGDEQLVSRAVERRVQRASGLLDKQEELTDRKGGKSQKH
jgi:exodeoxyribonuclease V alpha subunit